MLVHISGKVHESSGRGLSGVLVSNGELIVQTDADGGYAIEADPRIHSFVFVSLPDRYRADGSFYQRVPEASGTIDFALVSEPERTEREFVLAHITDTHIVAHENCSLVGANTISPRRLARDLAQLEAEAAPNLIINTGDLTNMGTMPELQAYKKALEGVKAPIMSQFGGHDGDEEYHEAGHWGATFRGAGSTCVRNYEQVLGPVNYSFDWGGRHFVLYANEDYMFSEYDQIRMARWFWEDLALQPEGREIILAVHWPPSRAFLDRLSAYNVTLVLYGHTHASKVFTYRNILVATPTTFCFGGTDSNPRGYRLVQFKEQGSDMEFRPLSRAAPRVETPGQIQAGQAVLDLTWECRLPAHMHRAAPVVHEGDLLISLQDEDDARQAGVCRVAGDTGQILWHSKLDSSVRNSVALAGKDRCIAVSIAGRLYCLDTRTGRVIWQRDTRGFPERWVNSSPVVAGDTVYMGAKSGYGAYDATTGVRRWETRFIGTLDLIADAIGDKWGCYASPCVYRDLLVALVPRRGFVAMRRDNGRVEWERGLKGTEDFWASPIVVGDLLVSGGDNGKLILLRPDSGETVWHRFVIESMPYHSNWVGGLAVTANRIYAVTVEGKMLCCALETGDVLWGFQSGEDLLDMPYFHREIRTILAPPVPYRDMVIVCGLDGGLYLLDAESGECRSHSQFDAPVTAAPCVLDDGFCVASWDGRLYRYRG